MIGFSLTDAQKTELLKIAGEIEAAVLADPQLEKYTAGKEVRKVIVVPGKIINVVV